MFLPGINENVLLLPQRQSFSSPASILKSVFFIKQVGLAYKTRLTLPSFIQVPVPRQDRKLSYVRGIDFASVSMVFRLDFGIVLTVWYFFFISFNANYIHCTCSYIWLLQNTMKQQARYYKYKFLCSR